MGVFITADLILVIINQSCRMDKDVTYVRVNLGSLLTRYMGTARVYVYKILGMCGKA